jgi:hypothetical protein
MLKYSHGRLFTKALVASGVLNALMIMAGLSGGAQGRSTFLTRLSDVVAAPPGTIITHCCAPLEHTARAFIWSMVEATGISILFYGLIAWLILELVYWKKRAYAAGTPR